MGKNYSHWTLGEHCRLHGVREPAGWISPSAGTKHPRIMPNNAFIEAFNGEFRRGMPVGALVPTRANAGEKMKAWRRFYNEDRPRNAIGYKVQIALTEPGGVAPP